MLLPIAVVVVLVQIIAKSQNYNIKPPKNPDFDIRVRRDVGDIDAKRVKNELISEILQNIETYQAIEILDELENILNHKIVISKTLDTPNDEVEKTSEIALEDVDIGVDEIRQFIEYISNIRDEENPTDTRANQDIKLNRNTDDKNQNVSPDFDRTTTETIDNNIETSDIGLEELLKGKIVLSESKDTIADLDLTSKHENTLILINNLNQDNNKINRDTNDKYETESPDFDKTAKASIEEDYEITKFIGELSDIVKDLKLTVVSNAKRDLSTKNKDNKQKRNNLSIIEIITKDRFKRKASPDSAFMNFFNNMYNKVYNITHTDNTNNIENDNISNNLNVNTNYNQFNDLYNQQNINNDNDIINNQAYQYYNNFNRFNATDYNQNGFASSYNQNRLDYNGYQYPINTPINGTYNNIYNTAYNNAYRTYPYNYGYSYNPYNYNNQYNINNSSINNNHPIDNNLAYGYNLTEVRDINAFNDNATSTEPTIIQGCILCSYIGCPVNYKRVGYMCIKNRG